MAGNVQLSMRNYGPRGNASSSLMDSAPMVCNGYLENTKQDLEDIQNEAKMTKKFGLFYLTLVVPLKRLSLQI